MFVNNLKILRRNKGLTQTELGQHFGLSKTAISLYESGKRGMDSDLVKKLADFFDCTTDYLLQQAAYPGSNMIALKKSSIVHLPIYGSIAAGPPIDTIQENEGTFPFDTNAVYLTGFNIDDFFFLRVKGDSMEPAVHDGGLVLVRKQEHVEQGQIAVVLCDDMETATLKKYYLQGDQVFLQSINPSYPPIVKPAAQCQIIGRALWQGGNL